MQLSGLTNADKEALDLLVKAATIMNEIFYLQVMHTFIMSLVFSVVENNLEHEIFLLICINVFENAKLV